jgi:hypothetical protein
VSPPDRSAQIRCGIRNRKKRFSKRKTKKYILNFFVQNDFKNQLRLIYENFSHFFSIFSLRPLLASLPCLNAVPSIPPSLILSLHFLLFYVQLYYGKNLHFFSFLGTFPNHEKFLGTLLRFLDVLF